MSRRDRYATVVLVRADQEVARWALEGWDRRDLAVVDTVAHLQLTARRVGCTIQVREACAELVELLDLAGLAELVARCGRSGLEAVGKSEGCEEIGVEEVVMPDDPVA